MAAANSVDEYISKRNREYIEAELLVLVIGLAFLAYPSYELVKTGYPYIIYAALAIPLVVFVRGLIRRRKIIGKQVWEILCPSCNQYIPLHQFECPPPCDGEYIDRSIIEGCPKCKARYKKEGHDAFRYAICENCDNKLDFSEPYDFKSWSVLSKGQTWDTETIVVKNSTIFSAIGIWVFVLGFFLFLLEKINYTNETDVIQGGILVSVFGLLFMIIHKFLYGDTKRIPNPTFKRDEEAEGIYVKNSSVVWNLALYGGLLLFLAFGLLLYGMFYVSLFLPYGSDPGAGERSTYSPLLFVIAIGGIVCAFLLILAHSIWYKEYIKIPNPEYKEDKS